MLPKIKSPTYSTILPSSKKEVWYRPFDVREEKILLMARQSGEPSDFYRAISQISQNCLVDPSLNVQNLPLFDVSYLFTKIRAVSVSNISKVSYKDNEDGEIYSFDIDLEKIEVKFPEVSKTTYKVNDDISFILKDPPVSLYCNKEFYELDDDKMFDKLASSCLKSIFDKETTYDISTSSEAEINEFINSLPAKYYSEIKEFLNNTPTLYYKVEYTNKNGKKVEIELRSIEDFFIFG